MRLYHLSVVKEGLSWVQNVYVEWEISWGKFCSETFFMEGKSWKEHRAKHSSQEPLR